MNLEFLIKYLIWVAFFIAALAGIYLTLRNIGAI
jgi:hypothetical protein